MPAEKYGNFRVFEQLGEGGMATVHRAEMDTPTGIKPVALKRLIPKVDRTPVTLFLDEARLLRYLQHPNIPTFYDSGRVFGTYFIAMEYIAGPTLRRLIDHCSTINTPMPQALVLNLTSQLLDALDYAHKRRDEQGRPLGIIHRDVTPANLILDATGTLKLVDFGLAKASLASEPSATGVIKGKLAYVAPEYTRGKIDHRADLWAVGIIMYELLTGRPLFRGEQPIDTIHRVRELPIPRPSIANPEVSPEIDDLVMTALQRDPAERWTSAHAMRHRVDELISRIGQVERARIVEWVQSTLAQTQPRPHVITPVVGTPTVREPPPPPQPLRHHIMVWGFVVLVLAALGWSLLH